MKRILCSIILIAVFTQILISCSFIPESFCSTASQFSDHLIISGLVIEEDDDGIDVEVIEVIRGVETNNIIRIWDGSDFDCNGLFSMAAGTFVNVNDQVILILPKIESIENDWDVIGDYRWPDVYTSTSMLEIEGTQVNGLISGDAIAPPGLNLTTFPYAEFAESFIENNNCTEITNTRDILTNDGIKIYPNPTNSEITIESRWSLFFMEVNVVDITGKTVLAFDDIRTYSSIPVNDLTPGIYFLYIHQDIGINVIRFVKQ